MSSLPRSHGVLPLAIFLYSTGTIRVDVMGFSTAAVRRSDPGTNDIARVFRIKGGLVYRVLAIPMPK